MPKTTETCFLCDATLIDCAPSDLKMFNFCHCPNCKRYRLFNIMPTTHSAQNRGASQLEIERSKVRKVIRFESEAYSNDMNRTHGEWPLIDNERWEELASHPSPTIIEYIDNLIEYLGDLASPHFSRRINPNAKDLMVHIGAVNEDDVSEFIQFCYETKLLEYEFSHVKMQRWHEKLACWLTFDGWQRYEDIKSSPVRTKKQGFMAMDFRPDDTYEVGKIYLAYQEALKEIGFDLIRVDTHEKTGLIPEKILVDIRESMFVISDLTYENHGAYWEAGVGEGMNKKVIYSCSKAFLDQQKNNKLHFDINSHHRIQWSLEDDGIPTACERLINIVKNEFPDI